MLADLHSAAKVDSKPDTAMGADYDSQCSPTFKEREKGLSILRLKRPKISDFEVQQVIGVGNFGRVHKAFNIRDDRVCALKILRKESVAQMKHVDHIISEREVL